MILLETSITNRTPEQVTETIKTLLKNILMKISITKSCSCNRRKTPRCRPWEQIIYECKVKANVGNTDVGNNSDTGILTEDGFYEKLFISLNKKVILSSLITIFI